MDLLHCDKFNILVISGNIQSLVSFQSLVGEARSRIIENKD